MLVYVVELAASGAIKQRPHQLLVIVRAPECNHSANIAPTITAPDTLQEPTDCSRQIAEYDGVYVANIMPISSVVVAMQMP